MKLYVSIPCYGGMIHTQTVLGLFTSITRAMKEGLLSDYNINLMGDSLIHRCRNSHANDALRGQYDALLTIDSDIVFTYDDFKRILSSPHEITGGIYPLKTLPPVMNFNPFPGEGTELLKTNRGYDYDAFLAYREKYADSTGYAKVRHLPTGFLLVRMPVLAKLSESAEVYGSFEQDTGRRYGSFDFYPSRVVDRELESEDWGFCRLAQEAGFSCYLDTKITLGHVGSHTYKMGQFFAQAEIDRSGKNDTV